MKKKGFNPAALVNPYSAAFSITFLVVFSTQLSNMMSIDAYLHVQGVKNLEPAYPYIRAVMLTQLWYSDGGKLYPLYFKILKVENVEAETGEEFLVPLTVKEYVQEYFLRKSSIEAFYCNDNNGCNPEDLNNNWVKIELPVNENEFRTLMGNTFKEPTKLLGTSFRKIDRFCIIAVDAKDQNRILVWPPSDYKNCKGVQAALSFTPDGWLEVLYAWPPSQ